MSTIANLIDWFGCYEVQHNRPLTLLPALAMPAIAALALLEP
ncbi:hypothetical protein [Stenomitos frigidus]|nr:hypothetical protein [Stenomitos frigidus]